MTDVLVQASSAPEARDMLMLSDEAPLPPLSEALDSRRHVASRLLASLALIAIIAWCATELFV